MFLKAQQTSWKSLNTKMSTSSTGKTLWGLMVTSVLSATRFYHPPLTDWRLLPRAPSHPWGCSTAPWPCPTVPPLPWALVTPQVPWALSGLLPSQVHPPGHCAAEQERLQWLLARLHCRPWALCQQKDTNPAGYKHPPLGLCLWHRGDALLFTMGQTWC